MVSRQSYYFSCIVTFYLFFLVSVVLCTLACPPRHYCRQDQRDALLEFKHEFPASSGNEPWKTSKDCCVDGPCEVVMYGDGISFRSWNKSGDCCSWDGVECDAKSGQVISLELINSNLNSPLKTNTSLLKLQHLQSLTLKNCSLDGEIPFSLGNLSHLTLLDLSLNKLAGHIPSSLGNLSHLTLLYLSKNELEGQVPSSLGNLYQLTLLDLLGNRLVGQVPSSLGNLSHLTHLVLSANELVGQLPASLGNLTKLRTLALGNNNFSGNIPVSFAKLEKLSRLYLGSNQFTSGDFLFLLPNLTSLSTVYLNSNNFGSKFPPDMSGLHNLEIFDASGNSFSGPFPRSLFTNPLLSLVDLTGNHFKGPIEFGNTSFPSKLERVFLARNLFDGPIPKSTSKLVKLRVLDVSENNLEGQVPGFLKRMETTMLKLSYNAFSSFGKSWDTPEDSTIQELYLNANSFRGPFPHWTCNLRSLMLLELSNNLFNGSIPPCLRNSTSFLEVLALRNNSLGGIIPDIPTSLRVFDVSRNQLEGKLPKSLIRCKDMQVLNVERNKIKDQFPFWSGSSPMLKVLLLPSNQFYGPLYHRNVSIGFRSLSVIDISQNHFTGKLPPSYFSNWLQMVTSSGRDNEESSTNDQYMDGILMNSTFYNSSMEMVNKGIDLEFERIHRDYKAIDFSGNRLWGNIPQSIGLLKSLRLLNLSGNAFTGNIPPSFKNLTNLEALDLSRNRLSGQIPPSLGHLTSLSYMNFSYNNLEGPVPRGTQFQSQHCSSFINNPRLHGLEEICVKSHVPNPTPQQSDEFSEPEEQVINWISAAIAYVPGVFGGLVIGHMFGSHIHEWLIKKFGRNKPRVVTRRAR